MTKEELYKIPLTYEFMKLNFPESSCPKFSIYPRGMYEKAGEYLISVQLDWSCDVEKQLRVVNEKTRYIAKLESHPNNISDSRKFTVGDLCILFELVGLGELIDKLIITEII